MSENDFERRIRHYESQLHHARRKNANQKKEIKALRKLLERSLMLDVRIAISRILSKASQGEGNDKGTTN